MVVLVLVVVVVYKSTGLVDGLCVWVGVLVAGAVAVPVELGGGLGGVCIEFLPKDGLVLSRRGCFSVGCGLRKRKKKNLIFNLSFQNGFAYVIHNYYYLLLEIPICIYQY